MKRTYRGIEFTITEYTIRLTNGCTYAEWCLEVPYLWAMYPHCACFGDAEELAHIEIDTYMDGR